MHGSVVSSFEAVATSIVLVGLSVVAHAQGPPDLSGMWSDPPASAIDLFCRQYCTEIGIERLNELLDDPANDARPFPELRDEAVRYQADEYFRPRLTAAALQTYPLDPADDPGFLRCEPWGAARQIFAPHQLELRQHDDRVELRYGEWDARRTVHLDGRVRPAGDQDTLLGFSVGRYEGDTLVVETAGVRENQTAWRSKHSEELRIVERYRRSDSGDRLEMVVTMEDPWSTKEPLVLRRDWGYAPDERILPYENCEPPTEFRRQERRP
jgi:hypothetical protein